MEFIDLMYFVKAAELESFTRAADELHVTQPGISKAISRLEKELDTPLFTRGRSKVVLNDHGKVFLNHALRILDMVEQSKHAIHTKSGEQKKLITISNEIPIMSRTAIEVFITSYPKLHLLQTCVTTANLKSALENKLIDFSLGLSPGRDSGLSWKVLFKDRFCVEVSEEHRLFEYEEIRLEELKNESFLIPNEINSTHEQIMRCCSLAGFSPNVVYKGNSHETLHTLVSKNYGISLIGRAVADIDTAKFSSILTNVKFIPLVNEYCEREIGIASLRITNLPKSARLLYDHLVDHLSQM